MYVMDFNKQVAIREETKVLKFKMMSFPGRTKTLPIFSSSNQYINRDKIKKLYVMSTTACLFVSGENCINICHRIQIFCFFTMSQKTLNKSIHRLNQSDIYFLENFCLFFLFVVIRRRKDKYDEISALRLET